MSVAGKSTGSTFDASALIFGHGVMADMKMLIVGGIDFSFSNRLWSGGRV
jgi:hypothetical protein